jgi:O-antigen ligase
VLIQRENAGRIFYYLAALQAFWEHPLTGVDPFNYLTSAYYWYPIIGQHHYEAHNLLLQIAAEQRLAGLCVAGEISSLS